MVSSMDGCGVGAGRRREFCSSSPRICDSQACLSNPGQNAPNLPHRNIHPIQLGINRHKNDVCRRFEVVDYCDIQNVYRSEYRCLAPAP
jgi:hypothetical protein